jgi:hypothetical protein
MRKHNSSLPLKTSGTFKLVSLSGLCGVIGLLSAIAFLPVSAQDAASTPGQTGSGAPAAVNGTSSAGLVRQSDPEAAAIIDSYLAAIGGRELLASITDRVSEFRNVKHQPTGETVANIKLLMKDKICIREEWDIEGFEIKGEKLAFIQIYNGREEQGWVQMLGTVSSLEGRTLQVFVWDKYMDDFFCHWEEDGYTLKLAGEGIIPGENGGADVPCDIVAVSDFSGRQTMRFFFSKTSGLVLKKEWQDADATANTQQPARKEQYYRMYRPLTFMDGSKRSVKFPLRLEIYVDGDLDTERIYTSVKVNSSLSDKLFDKPAGKPFDGAINSKTDVQKEGAAPKKAEGSVPKRGKKGPSKTDTKEPVPTPANEGEADSK